MNRQSYNTFIISLILFLGVFCSLSLGQGFYRKLIDLGNMKNVVTNFGMIEDGVQITGKIIPQNSYLYKGSLWVGARLPNGDTHVTSGCGNLEMRFPEWFPSGDSIVVVDEVGNSRVYVSQYADTMQLNGHVPLGIHVTQKVYTHHNKDYMLMEFDVENIGVYDILSDLYIGFKADFDVMDPGDKTNYPENDITKFLDDLEVSCMTNTESLGGNFVGGTKVFTDSQKVFSAWDIESDLLSDSDMYSLLSTGTPTVIYEIPDDYRVMQSTGPFNLRQGDSLTVFFGVAQANNTNQLTNRFEELNSLLESRLAGPTARKAVMVSSIHSNYYLDENYPNPANPSTAIQYGLPQEGRTILKIYDILGREVKTLIDDNQAAGSYKIAWDGKDKSGNRVSSGVYIYKLRSGSFQSMKKILILY